MDLVEHADFLDPLDVRFEGHRIGIDDVLYYYLKGYSDEAILTRFPSLTSDQIEAAVAYYHRNKVEMDRYLRMHAEWVARRRATLDADPPPVVLRIRELMRLRQRETA